MRKALLTVILMCLLWLPLAGNPDFVQSGLSRVWFDSAGDFWMSYRPFWYSWGVMENLRNLAFFTGSGTYAMPDSFVQPPLTPYGYCHINLSQAVPGFGISRHNDSFSLLNSPSDPPTLRWGPESGYQVNLRPLRDGQYAALSWVLDGQNIMRYVWAKTVSEEGLEEDSHCKIRVEVTDDQGHPVRNFPLKLFLGNPLENIHTMSYTDTEGGFEYHNLPMLHQLRLQDPVNAALAGDFLLYPEPEDSLFIPVSVACHHTAESPGGVLSLHPNLLRNGLPGNVSILWDNFWQLDSSSRVAIYDLRGRELQTRPFPLCGNLSWNLPKLPKGIYFIALHSGGKLLGSQRLTILK